MQEIEKVRFICFDCETTGLNINEDRVIEIAWVIFEGETIISQNSYLINPRKWISPENSRIHNIDNDMVRSAPLFSHILPELRKAAAGCIPLGHCVSFDIHIVNAETKRLKEADVFDVTNFVDTLKLARWYGQSDTNTLKGLCNHFRIETANPNHRALPDAMATIEIFKKLSGFLFSLENLMHIMKSPVLLQAMPFGKYKGKSFSDIPLSTLKSMIKTLSLDEDLKYTIEHTIEKKDVPQHNCYDT